MLTFPDCKFFRANSLKLDGVKKLWGKEGYLPKKESQAEKEDNAKSVLEGSAFAEHIVGNFPFQPEQEMAGPLEGEEEKRQLASTLFVGIGSQSSISLVWQLIAVS